MTAVNSDIGRAISRALSAGGARVLAVARDEERTRAVVTMKKLRAVRSPKGKGEARGTSLT